MTCCGYHSRLSGIAVFPSYRVRQLQEVFSPRASACGDRAPIIRYGAEDGEFGFKILLQTHDGRDVAAAVTVVRCRPHGDNILVLEVVLVTLVDELVGTGNKLKAIDVVELAKKCVLA